MTRSANTDHPIHPLLRDRHSPRAFSDQPVDAAALRALLEAARWAPSAFNDQPWTFLLATRDDAEGFARLLGGLVPFNQAWAQRAGALVVCLTRRTYRHDGSPHAHARHDLGLAVAQLTVQATALGLCVHQMAGIDSDHLRAECAIPDGWDVVSALAVGHPGDPAALPEALAERERAPRVRRPQAEFVFGARFGEAPALTE